MLTDMSEKIIDLHVPEQEAYIDALLEKPALSIAEVPTTTESLLKHRFETTYPDGQHQPKRLEISLESTLTANPDSEVAQTAQFVARNILVARSRGVGLDLSQRHQVRQAAPSSRERAARLIAGDYAVDLLANAFKASSSVEIYELQRHYLEAEAAIGGEILGDRNSAFYCFDEHTFIWHPAGAEANVRYIIRKNDVLKQFADHQFSRLAGQELENFHETIRQYYQLVGERLYSPTTKTSAQRSELQATNEQFAVAA